jgi:hypothetical protein
MADITVDVNLPSTISVDVTSPTQVLATNISIPGPQGPRGEKGNPTSINNLTAENIIITGSDGNIVYNSGLNTIFISGNSGYFQSAVNSLTTNLNNTGANLNTSINSLSGLFTGYTGNLDATYATDSQLNSTGNTLNIKIDNLSGYVNSQDTNISNNLASTGSSLQSNINTLSSNLNSTGSNLENKITSLSGTLTGNYLTTNVASNTYATISNLNSTGSTLNNSINSLSGTLTSTYATINNLASTGSTLQSNISSTGSSLDNKIGSLSGTLTSTYATITNLASTGSTLNTKINDLSGYVNTQDNSISNNLISTGNTLQNSINSLSGSSVLLYGNQSVGGIKTFRDNVYINNLFVTGTETIVSTNNFNVQSPYVLLNLTGGAVDGGIFFVTGSGLTGINSTGPIIGFDHSTKFKFGVSTRNSDLSTLPDIASVQDIQAYSGVADNKFSTITNLANTGSNLVGRINSLSGTLTSNYATITNLASTGSTLVSNLASTGSTLQTNINTVSSNLVLTGNNLEAKISSLSGTLTSNYATITNLASTGSTLNSSINSLSGNLTGNYVTKFNGQFTNRPTVNGTGVLLSGEAASLPTTILYTTGNQIKSGRLIIGDDANSIVDPNSIYTLSLQTNSPRTWLEILNNSGANKGVFFGIEGNDFEQYNWQAGDIKFFTSENFSDGIERLRIKNDGKVGIGTNSPSEKLEIIGNIKASGASFDNRPTVNGTGVLLSGEVASLPQTIVYTTGNQTISGNKNFVQNVIVGDQTQEDLLVVSGNQISFGVIPTVSGNLLLTGVDLSSYLTSSTANSTYATINNLANTGSTLVGSINSLSGTLTGNYATILNLASTGSTLQTNINNLSNTYATITNVGLTGVTLNSSINSLSGLFTGYTGTLDTTYATDVQLFNTGSGLNTRINNLSGYVNSTDSNIVFTTGNQIINGNKNFYGDMLLSGANNRIGSNHYLSTDGDFVYIKQAGGNLIFSTEESFLADSNAYRSVLFNDRKLWSNGPLNANSIDWNERYLANRNGTPVLYWTGDNIGIGTNTPSEKLQVDGNIRINGGGGLYIYDQPNGADNRMVWVDGELRFENQYIDDYRNVAFLFNHGPLGETSLSTYNAGDVSTTILYIPSGRQGYIAVDSEVVHKTGNEIISGTKTFQTSQVNISGSSLNFGDIIELGTPVTFTQENNTETQVVDYIDTNVQITRGSHQALYNPSQESSWNGSGPTYTEWNRDGWDDLTNITNRTYVSLYDLWGGGIGANIVGAQLIMHDTYNNKYYKFYFTNYMQGGSSSWANDNDNTPPITYAGFEYTRTQIISTNKAEINGSNIGGYLDLKNRLSINGTGVLLSGEAGQVPDTIVQTSGTQTISGSKIFTAATTFSAATFNSGVNFNNNITVAQTGIFSSMDVSVDEMSISGLNLTLTSGTGIFNNGIDLNNSTIINAAPQIINVSSNFIISGNYNSRMIMANSSNTITGIIASGNATGFNLSIIQVGAGQIQITGSGNGIIINSYNNQFRTAGQYATISMIHTGNNRYVMYGNTST